MAGAKGLTAAAKLLTAGAVIAGIGGAVFLSMTPGSAPDAPPEASAPDAPPEASAPDAPPAGATPAAPPEAAASDAPAEGSMPDAPPDTAPGSLEAPESRAGSDAAALPTIAPDATADAADDPAPDEPAASELPEFDVVRVSPDGSALVAGRAAPGVDVAVTIEGAPAAQTVADGRGSFVAMFALAPSDQPRAMELQAQDAGGTRLSARETVIVAPQQVRAETGAATAPNAGETAEPLRAPAAERAASAGEAPGRAAPPQARAHPPEERHAAAPPARDADAPARTDALGAPPRAAAPATSESPAEPAPPGLFVASEEGIRVLRDTAPGAAPQVMDNIVIDAISYGTEGDVALTGRGAGSDPATVRIYIDEREISTTPMAPDGNWRAELPDIDPGVYTLRIDQIDAGGAVESRFETPFQRESPEQIARLRPDGHARSGVVTVQPGYTLWGISRSHYGRGILYVQVFEENRGQIRDPDLIYPGQVFDIPEIARDEIEALP